MGIYHQAVKDCGDDWRHSEVLPARTLATHLLTNVAYQRKDTFYDDARMRHCEYPWLLEGETRKEARRFWQTLTYDN